MPFESIDQSLLPLESQKSSLVQVSHQALQMSIRVIAHGKKGT